MAPEERVTPDGYHVWNWNPRGTGSEEKQARNTGSLAEHLTYLPGDKIRPQGKRGGSEGQRKSEQRVLPRCFRLTVVERANRLPELRELIREGKCGLLSERSPKRENWKPPKDLLTHTTNIMHVSDIHLTKQLCEAAF